MPHSSSRGFCKSLIQGKIDAVAVILATASNKVTFIKVPCLFLGNYIQATINDPAGVADYSAIAFTPGPTNLQVVNNKLYVPRQFSPLKNVNTVLKDIFEEEIKTQLGNTVEFVDDWNWYHRERGEIHCGTAVKHSTLNINWWENQP